MKKQNIFLLFVFLMMISGKLVSQTVQLTPNGMFDQVYDRFGNTYALSDLQIPASITGTGITIFSLPTQICVAGKFTLYFASGSVFDGNSFMQNVACQVFSHISNFINSNIPGGVNIYCKSLYIPGVSINPPAAQASSYYVPASPTNSNQGIIDGQVYKALTSGVDPYLTLPYNLTGGQFYHGQVEVNSSYLFNTDLTTTAIASNELDLYSVLLHEVMHTLGFMSLINFDGSGSFSGNYYSRYDMFLRDASGNPLLAPASALCPAYDISFVPNTNTVITPMGITAATGSVVTPQDITTCSTAVQYSSNSVTITVYTPNYFEPGSSLSHFEDMCTGTYTGNCVPTPTAPGYNDLYYVMANGTGTGSCYVKRHLTDEERSVLCDLGYSVNPSYGSAVVAGSQYSYGTTTCTPTNIVGINDGLEAGSIYTLITATSSAVISYSTLIANDIATSSLNVSCLELVYNNATFTPGTSDFTVSAAAGSGVVTLKYVPKDNNGNYGNATYVFVYFAPPGCASCNMVNNGGFENAAINATCGSLNSLNSMNCWIPYQDVPFLLDVSCTSSGFYGVAQPFSILNLGSTSNNRCVELGYDTQVSGSHIDAIKNSLSAPMLSGQTYQLSFWVKNQVSLNSPSINVQSTPVVITAASYTNYANATSTLNGNFPMGLDVLANFTVNASSTSWSLVTATFNYTPSVAGSALVIGINTALTASPNIYTMGYYACLIDEVSLINITTSPTFSIPANILSCTNASLSNLAQYASAVSGSYFSGAGVTNNGGQYDFNAALTLTPGVYPIVFTYTTANGCTDNLYQSVTVSGPILYLTASDDNVCPGNSVTLTATGNFTSVSWSTGSTNSFVVVNPMATDIYTATASEACGSVTQIIKVQVSFPPTLSLSVSNNGTVCSGASAVLTATGSYDSLIWLPGGSTASVAVVTPTTATAVYTAIGNPQCSNATSATIAVQITPSPTLSLSSSNNGSVCPGASVTLTAVGSYSDIVWQPVLLFTTNSIVVNPMETTVYTVIANPFCSSATETIEVQVTALPLPITSYSILPATLSGIYAGINGSGSDYIINSDVTVNGSATLENGSFLFVPNVKLIVPAGATLTVEEAHLYACSEEMWQGIVIKDGGMVNVFDNSLIEDAKIAIDASNQYTSTVQPVISLQNAIFNKNYKDIALTNYTIATNISGALQIDNSVFTCRDIEFGTTTSALRAATSSTTDNAAPYLQNNDEASLKAPYTNSKSLGIYLGNVGYVNTNGTYNGITIGDASGGAADFNLFDRHGVFINAENSNLTLQNNVFQNQLGGFAVMPVAPNAPAGYAHPAAAVMHRTYDARKTILDMRAANTDVGNRFWDCNRALEGRNVYEFRVNNAILRSAHTLTDVTQSFSMPGEYGFNLHSDRVNYYINDNEFTNLAIGISIPFSPSGGGSYSGLAIHDNIFSAPVSGFMTLAVYIGNPLGVVASNIIASLTPLPPTLPNYGWVNPPYPSGTFHPTGIAIIKNKVIDAWNGFNINGSMGLPVWIAENDITLADNSTSTITAQHGIELSGCISTEPRGQNIWLNSVQGSGTYTASNTSLVYCSQNAGYYSPRVNCNHLSNSNKGFVFAGSNAATLTIPGLQWRGNDMQNLNNGMRLEGAVGTMGNTLEGMIGTQGSYGSAMGNAWLGDNWSGDKYSIWTQNSTATNSPLYALQATYNIPTNVWGNPFPQSYASSTQSNAIVSATLNNFYCNWTQTKEEPPPPVIPHFTDELQIYLTNATWYHFLKYNDSLRINNTRWTDWYDDMTANSNLWHLETAQERLYEGNYQGAKDLLNSLSAANYVEANDISYYHLYANYLQAINEDTVFTLEDSLVLSNMANLCAIEYGASIYKARALYNSIYSTVMMYEDCSTENIGGRLAFNLQAESSNQIQKWNVELYPNPADNVINIVSMSKHESEELNITIEDLTGRTIYNNTTKTKSFVANVELNLLNGAYLMTIKNNNHESVTKKLLIAK